MGITIIAVDVQDLNDMTLNIVCKEALCGGNVPKVKPSYVHIMKVLEKYYNLRKNQYEALSAAELQYGKDSVVAGEEKDKLKKLHTEMMQHLEKARSNTADSYAALMATNLSDDVEFSIYNDLMLYNKRRNGCARASKTHGVFNTLYNKGVIELLGTEIEAIRDPETREKLQEYKTNLLLISPELESWYLGGKFLGNDPSVMFRTEADTDAAAMKILGMHNDEYECLKLGYGKSVSEIRTDGFIEAAKEDDSFEQHRDAILLVSTFPFIDKEDVQDIYFRTGIISARTQSRTKELLQSRIQQKFQEK